MYFCHCKQKDPTALSTTLHEEGSIHRNPCNALTGHRGKRGDPYYSQAEYCNKSPNLHNDVHFGTLVTDPSTIHELVTITDTDDDMYFTDKVL